MTPLIFALIWPAPWGRDRGPLLLIAALGFVVIAGWFTENRMLWPALVAELLVGIAAWRASPREGAVPSASLRRVTLIVGLVLVAAFAASVIERSDKALRLSSPAAVQVERDLRPASGVSPRNDFASAMVRPRVRREVLAEYFVPVTPRAMNHPDAQRTQRLMTWHSSGRIGILVSS